MATPLRKIEATEAVIKTASVEVKALTLNGKQMTLSLFRQLQNEPLIDPETAEIQGVPWGKVNYYWGDCNEHHLHIVWQDENSLRRSCVYEEPKLPWENSRFINPISPTVTEHYKSITFHMKTWAKILLIQDHQQKLIAMLPVGSVPKWDAPVTYLSSTSQWSFNYSFLHITIWPCENMKALVRGASHHEAARKKIEAEISGWYDLSLPPEQIASLCVADLQNEVRKLDNFLAKWRRNYTSISAVEQLFIAV